MPSLILPRQALREIRDIVYRTDVETGVRLVGTVEGENFLVLHVIGPGRRALQQACSYEPDNGYAEEVFNELLRENPDLRWLGELHVHPRGFPRLSSTDRETIREVLLGEDDALHPEVFVAGVIQRVKGTVRIRPLLFTKTNLKGERIHVRTKP
jgi:integrative and conjugative element protein (TIGR02256 family)